MQGKDIIKLVEQESFLNYCFKRNSEDVLYWEEWISKNPEQQQSIQDLKEMLILMGDGSRKRISEANFAELQKRINPSEQQLPVKGYPFWKKWSVAAAALLVICTGLFFYTRDSAFLQTARTGDVAPGGNKAILILANGEKVDLTYASNGAIANQSGIKITKTADGQIIYDMAQAAQDASSEAYNTIQTPVGGQYQVNLSDGTKVWLNSGSSLRYPLKFAGNERKVELKGEGYFEVAHNKAMPFKVNSSGQVVEVLGTHFNVMAYADEKVLKTTLLEGSVSITSENGNMLLKPGQQAQLSSNKITVVNNIDLEDVIAWKNGYFKFNESLESIMAKISRWYGVEVIYQMKPDPYLTYSGKISRTRNISAILKIIAFNGDVNFKIEGKKVYVTN